MKPTIFLTVILAVVLLMTMACNRQSKKQETDTQPQTSTPAATETAETQAKGYHDKLMSSFNANWEVEEPAATDYPAYYGGSFIDNNGKFVVCVVGNPSQHRSQIAAVIGSDDFLTESCTYSYREMMQVMDKIDAFLSNSSIPADHPFLARFAGAAADVFDNRVVVQLTEMDNTAIQAFKKDISGSPIVIFKKGEAPVI